MPEMSPMLATVLELVALRGLVTMLLMFFTDSGRRSGVYGASMASPCDVVSSLGSSRVGESGSSPSSMSSMTETIKNCGTKIGSAQQISPIFIRESGDINANP